MLLKISLFVPATCPPACLVCQLLTFYAFFKNDFVLVFFVTTRLYGSLSFSSKITTLLQINANIFYLNLAVFLL